MVCCLIPLVFARLSNNADSPHKQYQVPHPDDAAYTVQNNGVPAPRDPCRPTHNPPRSNSATAAMTDSEATATSAAAPIANSRDSGLGTSAGTSAGTSKRASGDGSGSGATEGVGPLGELSIEMNDRAPAAQQQDKDDQINPIAAFKFEDVDLGPRLGVGADAGVAKAENANPNPNATTATERENTKRKQLKKPLKKIKALLTNEKKKQAEKSDLQRYEEEQARKAEEFRLAELKRFGREKVRAKKRNAVYEYGKKELNERESEPLVFTEGVGWTKFGRNVKMQEDGPGKDRFPVSVCDV